MTAALKILASTQIPTTADATIYTVPAGKSAKLQTLALHNTGQLPVTVNVYVVPASGSIGPTRLVLSRYVINGYDTVSQEDVLGFVKGIVLEAGALVAVNSDTAAVLNAIVTGVEL